MNPKTRREIWTGPDHDIEVAIDQPEQAAVGLALVAHPHPLFGGTLDNKVTQTMARSFLSMGYVTLRPNFRGVGQSAGVHDNGEGEINDMIWLAQAMRSRLENGQWQNRRIAMAGFSFGAYVMSHVAQADQPEGLVLVGTACSRFPVAATNPTKTLVIHGEKDETVPLSSVLSWAEPLNQQVMVFPGVEHFFHGKLPWQKQCITQYYLSLCQSAT